MTTQIIDGAAKLPPHLPSRHPLGVLPEIRRDPIGFMERLVGRPEPVIGYRLGPKQSYLVKHPDGIKRVLQDNVRNYTKDHLSYTMVRWVGGNGLLTSQGDFWLRQRRIAAPAFHRQRIAAWGDMMVEETERMVAGWLPRAGETLNIADALTTLTLSIVGRALFGAHIADDTRAVSDGFHELSAQLVDRFRSGNVLPPRLPWGADRRWRRSMAEIDAVVYRIIDERRTSNTDTGDLISMLMLTEDADTGERMDDRQLRDEVLTMLLAGHETTAALLSWALAQLARSPAAAERLDDELRALPDRPLTTEDLPRLVYTRMVIDETLRLCPPVYLISRQVAEDDTICGYAVRGGSWLDLSPYVTHRSPEIWDRPNTFEPERFAPGRENDRPRYAYFPFLGGPRQCIGNTFALTEATLVLATIARTVRLTLPGDAAPLVPEPLITMRPKGGVWLRLGPIAPGRLSTDRHR